VAEREEIILRNCHSLILQRMTRSSPKNITFTDQFQTKYCLGGICLSGIKMGYYTGLTLPSTMQGQDGMEWCKDGKQHRDDKDPETGLTLPALVWYSGTMVWCKDGKQHRDDKDPETGLTLPAYVGSDGTKSWWKDDERHRDDKDPKTGLTLPAYIDSDGIKKWWNHGMVSEWTYT